VIAFRETRDERFLQTAEHLAGYIASNLPEDYVPWYDYADPGIIYKCKDASAGAIAACALLNFSEIHPKSGLAEFYRKLGLQMVNNLIDRYLTPVNSEDNSPAGILRHSCVVRPSDCEIIWGTYYLSEALLWILKRGIER
ncbi:MAG: glucuronyl hydrolase, partial [Candidatus Sumerlaeia bacterium]|nr:glucuronyl hydrolase [Candidatus Sumerlaeia bacterium]